eukprot:TRINITY_DN5302_c0_g1_i38.p1 TRINITY_DN5302_c0_g1~~TRINITY_DN5302_c0_g1_i38.p1  ORF type:complete len:149 (-),score=15.89 TRINITY_DN5302_c0_g1_i38:120-566(-)
MMGGITPTVSDTRQRIENQTQQDSDFQLALAASKATAMSQEDEILQKVLRESAGSGGPDPTEVKAQTKPTTSTTTTTIAPKPDVKISTTTTTSSSRFSSSQPPRTTTTASARSSGGSSNVVPCPYCDSPYPSYDELITHLTSCPKMPQ